MAEKHKAHCVNKYSKLHILTKYEDSENSHERN